MNSSNVTNNFYEFATYHVDYKSTLDNYPQLDFTKKFNDPSVADASSSRSNITTINNSALILKKTNQYCDVAPFLNELLNIRDAAFLEQMCIFNPKKSIAIMGVSAIGKTTLVLAIQNVLPKYQQLKINRVVPLLNKNKWNNIDCLRACAYAMQSIFIDYRNHKYIQDRFWWDNLIFFFVHYIMGTLPDPMECTTYQLSQIRARFSEFITNNGLRKVFMMMQGAANEAATVFILVSRDISIVQNAMRHRQTTKCAKNDFVNSCNTQYLYGQYYAYCLFGDLLGIPIIDVSLFNGIYDLERRLVDNLQMSFSINADAASAASMKRKSETLCGYLSKRFCRSVTPVHNALGTSSSSGGSSIISSSESIDDEDADDENDSDFDINAERVAANESDSEEDYSDEEYLVEEEEIDAEEMKEDAEEAEEEEENDDDFIVDEAAEAEEDEEEPPKEVVNIDISISDENVVVWKDDNDDKDDDDNNSSRTTEPRSENVVYNTPTSEQIQTFIDDQIKRDARMWNYENTLVQYFNIYPLSFYYNGLVLTSK